MSELFAVSITEGPWDSVTDVVHFSSREQAEEYKRKVESLDHRYEYAVNEITIVDNPLIAVEAHVSSDKNVTIEISDFNASEPVVKTYYNTDGHEWYSVSYITTRNIENAREVALLKFANIERLVAEGKSLNDAVDYLNLTDGGDRHDVG